MNGKLTRKIYITVQN